jgi:hypothetical protein
VPVCGCRASEEEGRPQTGVIGRGYPCLRCNRTTPALIDGSFSVGPGPSASRPSPSRSVSARDRRQHHALPSSSARSGVVNSVFRRWCFRRWIGDWTEKGGSGHLVKKNLLTGASVQRAFVLIALTFGGVAALLSWSPQAFADTTTSTSGANCPVTGASGTAGTAIPTSPSVDPVSTTSSQTHLAFTGVDIAVAALVGLLLVGAGMLLVFGSRAHRRRGAKVLGCAFLGVLFAHQLLPAGLASAATNCASPPAVLPESPNGILLPLSALLIVAGAYVWSRRRRAVS